MPAKVPFSIDELDEMAEEQRRKELRERRLRAHRPGDQSAVKQTQRDVTQESGSLSGSDDSFATPSSSDQGASEDSSSDDAQDLRDIALQSSDRKRRRTATEADQLSSRKSGNARGKASAKGSNFFEELLLNQPSNASDELDFDLSEYGDELKRIGRNQHEAFRSLIDRYDGESDGDVIDLATGVIVKDSGHLVAIRPQHRILDFDSDSSSGSYDSESMLNSDTQDDLGFPNPSDPDPGSIEGYSALLSKDDRYSRSAVENQLRERPAPLLDQIVGMLSLGGIR